MELIRQRHNWILLVRVQGLEPQNFSWTMRWHSPSPMTVLTWRLWRWQFTSFLIQPKASPRWLGWSDRVAKSQLSYGTSSAAKPLRPQFSRRWSRWATRHHDSPALMPRGLKHFTNCG